MTGATLSAALLRHVPVFMTQASQTALANGSYGVPEAEYDRTVWPRRAPRRV